MKRLLALTLVFVMALTAFAACGGKGGKKGEDGEVSELSQESGDIGEQSSDSEHSGEENLGGADSGESSRESLDSEHSFTASGDDSAFVDGSKAEESNPDDSKPDESKSDESKADDSKADDSKPDESKADDSKADDSKADESKGDDSEADDSKADESKADESKADESKPDDSVDNTGDVVGGNIIGSWSTIDEGVEIILTFNENGKGSFSGSGINLDMDWHISGGKLYASASFMGMTEELFEGADYEVSDSTLSIIWEDETIVFNRSNGQSTDTPDAGGEVDSGLIGSWAAEQDGVEMTFTFKEGGKGTIYTMGVTLNVDWYVSGGKLYASASFMGMTEELFEGADYEVSDSTLSITWEGATIVFDRSNGQSTDTPGDDTEPDIDERLFGNWVIEEEGVEVTVTFGANGKGTMSTLGIAMDMSWHVSDGRIYATIGYGDTIESLFDGEEYTVSGNVFCVTTYGVNMAFYKEDALYKGELHHVKIEVENYGVILLELDPYYAPITVDNFLNLAESGFYNGLTFHRIMQGFMIQGGCPNGDGTGRSDTSIRGEFSENGIDNFLSHKRGVISMARSNDMNSASCQFFICDADSTFLDGKYAAFGWVTEGMDVVDAIARDAKPTDSNGTIPADEQPVITSITIID